MVDVARRMVPFFIRCEDAEGSVFVELEVLSAGGTEESFSDGSRFELNTFRIRSRSANQELDRGFRGLCLVCLGVWVGVFT